MLVLQATNAGVRRPGYKANAQLGSGTPQETKLCEYRPHTRHRLPVADPSAVKTVSWTVRASVPNCWVTVTMSERPPSPMVYNTGLKPITTTKWRG